MKTLTRGVCIMPFLVCLLGIAGASAQPVDSRVEVGGHVSILRIGGFNGTNAGLGGRLSMDLTDWAAAQAAFSYFPSDRIETGESTTPVPGLRFAYHRRRLEALFGVKLGQRFERFGAFANVRPGFTRLFHRGLECVGEICTRVTYPSARALPDYRTEFVLNLGGVLEFYPTARTVARFELGDTLIRNASAAPPCPGERCTTHNVSSTLGIGVRF